MADTLKERPVFRNIHITQIASYRLPAAGLVSILHRISGALLFFMLPLLIWLFDTSVTSEISYGRFTSAFTTGIGFVPGLLIKLIVLALIWAYLHHLIAGVRHLWMDATHSVGNEFGRQSAVVTLGLAVLLTLALGYKLFF